MDTTGMTGKLYQACQWISRLAYLNLLWLLFIGVGLVFFGVAPSTVAMFTIIRKWLQGERELPIFSTFMEIFKREFWASNRLGLVLMASSFVIWFDWQLIGGVQGTLYPILAGCLIGVSLLFMMVLTYIFPVYVHYENKTFQYIKVAFLLGISYPLYSFVMLLAVICVLALSLFFNGIGFLFFGSGISYILMYISNLLFSKLAQKYDVSILSS
ncbi:YesL family protein [Robertmurraya korlensis]|uniref:YesL family protein n=1 Tax=Robertmurraya korlensis TaxID=519977 RepID=UPI00082633AD|nr:DUF624 domain-containing protein [Robertmurraya korlensis]